VEFEFVNDIIEFDGMAHTDMATLVGVVLFP
jgi:hypothetical protein